MAFVLLRDEDGQDFLTNSTNISSITPADDTCIVTVHKGTHVRQYADQGPSRLQNQFRLSAMPGNALRSAIDLADEIALADKDCKTLDLRHRCPPPVMKQPYDPAAGW